MANKKKNKQSQSITSKAVGDLYRINSPIARHFNSSSYSGSWFQKGEYDLISIFKLLQFESYFSRAVQKKVALICKSGFSITSDDDEIKKYFNDRFGKMMMQTGVSIDTIINQLAFYLTVCSNAFIIKVRDPLSEDASHYVLDGKIMSPVVGLFMPHPTTMFPVFKNVVNKDTNISERVLDKWRFSMDNGRTGYKEFSIHDVVHFSIFKEDGMVFGAPEIIPVMDDIMTLRRIEEDLILLINRDVFPTIHYSIEKPQMVDAATRTSEIELAREDMRKIAQEGGLVTDARHNIKYVSSGKTYMDVKPYLEYFKLRVFTGLGVTPVDMVS